MGAMASQITSLAIVYSTVYSRRMSKKTSKLRVTGLCAGNSSATDEFPAQMASDAENVSIWWRHHAVGNIVFLILMKFTPIAATGIIILTTSGAASEDMVCYHISQSPEDARCGWNGVGWCCSGAYQISARNAFIRLDTQLWKEALTHLPWIKWPTFRRRHFQVHFHEWKVLCFDLNFIEVSS